jgi:hypothetical protein
MQPELRRPSWIALFLGFCTAIPFLLIGSRGIVSLLLAATLALATQRVVVAWRAYGHRGHTELPILARAFLGDRLLMLALGTSVALAIVLISLLLQDEPESGTSLAQVSAAEVQEACKTQHRMDSPMEVAKTTTRTDFNGDELAGPEQVLIYKSCNYPPLKSSPSDDVYTQVRVLSVGTNAVVETGGAMADRFDASCSAMEAKYTFVHQGTSRLDPITIKPDQIVTIHGKSWKSTGNDLSTELGFLPKRGEAIILRSDHVRLDSVGCL